MLAVKFQLFFLIQTFTSDKYQTVKIKIGKLLMLQKHEKGDIAEKRGLQN